MTQTRIAYLYLKRVTSNASASPDIMAPEPSARTSVLATAITRVSVSRTRADNPRADAAAASLADTARRNLNSSTSPAASRAALF